MKLTDSHFGVRSAVLQRHERPASRHHGKGSRHSSPNWTSTLKARCAYKKCRRLVDVKNVGQSLQVPREDAQEELCRKLRTNCGVVKFCSLAHKATPFGAMKKLAPWSVVLMLLQLDTGAGCVKARFFFLPSLTFAASSRYLHSQVTLKKKGLWSYFRAQRIKSKLLTDNASLWGKVGKTCLPFWHVSSDQTQNLNLLGYAGDSSTTTTQLYRGYYKPF